MAGRSNRPQRRSLRFPTRFPGDVSCYFCTANASDGRTDLRCFQSRSGVNQCPERLSWQFVVKSLYFLFAALLHPREYPHIMLAASFGRIRRQCCTGGVGSIAANGVARIATAAGAVIRRMPLTMIWCRCAHFLHAALTSEKLRKAGVCTPKHRFRYVALWPPQAKLVWSFLKGTVGCQVATLYM